MNDRKQTRKPRPPEPPPAPRRSPESLLDSIGDAVIMVRRSVAGYTSLTSSYQSAKGNLSPGARKKGMPIFRFSASAGSETVEVVADLKLLSHDHVDYVLPPLILCQGLMAHNALRRLVADANELLGQMEAAIGPVPPSARQLAAEVEDDDADDEGLEAQDSDEYDT